MQLGDEQPFRFLIHDRDTKFSHAFDEVFRTEGIKVIRTPVQAPNANAHAERWVRTVRADCLDRILILGRRHLEHVLRVYRHHYNEHRPHRALALLPPDGRHPTPVYATDSPTAPRSPRRTHPRIRGRLSLRTLRASWGRHRGTRRRLDAPRRATSPRHRRAGGADPISDPRPRHQVHGRLRRGIPVRRHPDDPHTSTTRANAFVERWIGTVRRECLDRVLIVDACTSNECSRSSFAITTSISTASSANAHRSTGRCQSRTPTSCSTVSSPETCSERSFASTSSQRDQTRIGFPAPRSWRPRWRAPHARRLRDAARGPLADRHLRRALDDTQAAAVEFVLATPTTPQTSLSTKEGRIPLLASNHFGENRPSPMMRSA